MLYIILVDDEPLARSRLRRQIDEIGGCEIVAEGSSGDEGLSLCRKLKPDIVLLDIRMPGMNGLDTAQLIGKLDNPPVIIFCTAYDEHALSAFEKDALDYLVKPIRQQRLEQALQKARQYLHKEPEATSQRHYLRSKVGERVELIPLDSVIYLLAEHKYTTVGYEQGEAVIDDTLKLLEKEFPDQLFRIHRNALVSKNRLRGLRKAEGGHPHVLLHGTDIELEVSRRNLPAVRKLIREM